MCWFESLCRPCTYMSIQSPFPNQFWVRYCSIYNRYIENNNNIPNIYRNTKRYTIQVYRYLQTHTYNFLKVLISGLNKAFRLPLISNLTFTINVKYTRFCGILFCPVKTNPLFICFLIRFLYNNYYGPRFVRKYPLIQ